ncbi:histone demethylase JARID1D [Westerdykella ornata]|uniref:Histone demethylase JARID1D n=1 Tax=Westerdykella ornata TaxID=318751 RepID=A0A6A6JTU1_WESOR|nr:histone demethylase JARID1D [Westerdykella ornata]KAF2279992.1 histone demethylase JARID1D [Westerdykella ornata]
MSSFRVATGPPPHPTSSATAPAIAPAPAPTAPKTRSATGPPSVNGAQMSAANGIPLSARKALPLELATVERRRPWMPQEPPKRDRMFGLQEAPTYRPTEEEFKDPIQYISKIRHEASQYGIAKIIPPASWDPPFAIDTERFHFKTRRQELNSIEGGTRANLNYLDQLSKFHRQHGNSLTRFPSVDKRPLDLYKLKKAVETRGGFERVCKGKKWAEIGRDLGYSGKIMSSLSTSLKNSYQKWLHPYEEYLRVVKPGVHQLLEMENGGPYTPSPAPSPLKKSAQGTPAGTATQPASPAFRPSSTLNPTDSPLVKLPATANPTDSPALRASAALNASLQNGPSSTSTPEPMLPSISSGFGAVNAPGFTAVNVPSRPHAQVPSSLNLVNAPNGASDNTDSQTSTPLHSSFMLSANNTPDLRHGGVNLPPLSNGQAPLQLKRNLSPEPEGSVVNESDPAPGRRSKRVRKEAAPTVAGSHMTQPRLSTPQPLRPRPRASDEPPGDRCETCGSEGDAQNMLLCDSCDAGYHGYCLDPPIKGVPEYDWHCPRCLVGTGEFGFEEGGIYSLRQFQEKAHNFKEGHFANKMPYDVVTNQKKPVSEDDVEREFWRLVESITETVEVEYGADIHSTTHGSGFPTIEKNPRDPYSIDPWNLNVLPHHPESLFRYIRSDISGMTVPWLYVGMIFSTFCWHNEDHYTYSANYQHFGATKTWYGIPAEDSEKFEQAMRDAVPELFETQPDLLFQLVTLLTPGHLVKAGVRVYALDQRAGEFVITFPQAYHAGFNHGFNFNEAVNFAPSDWEPFGEAGVQRLQDYRRQPCFSHDELLLAAASRKDTTIKVAKWLAPALERMRHHELEARAEFIARHKAAREHICKLDGQTDSSKCQIQFTIDDADVVQEDLQICSYCKAYSYLSRFHCAKSNKTVCLRHAGLFECCPESTEESRLIGEGGHTLIHRMTDSALEVLVQKVVDKANTPEAWEKKLDKLLEDGPKPQLKALRALLNEGEKIDWELNGLTDLREYVEKCTEVAEEAMNYTARKQQARRKVERTWRGRGAANKAAAAAAEVDEKEREYRKVENLQKLLETAEELSFDCPELVALQERFDSITEFQQKAQAALRDSPAQQSIARLDELLEEGRSFNVELPEIESIDKVVQQLRWLNGASNFKNSPSTLQEITDFIKQGIELGMPESHPEIHNLQKLKAEGELWETKAREVMSFENIHYQQLEALFKLASTLPVNPETLGAVDETLKKQRDAKELIVSLYERSKDPDFRKRPRYKEVRDAMEALNALNTKPHPTIELEKEQKRHEDWMRKGKKLFGKANAPLHILHAHMKQVDERNKTCFDLADQPRMPVEPASREATPVEGETLDGSGSSRDVFCICRRPEAGTMIECELCHEWYHSKCFKLARGKVKEEDKYICPICDWRVKIPRDATRPKLEDLQAWQEEIPNLPFQPEEEETLESIIDIGLHFREYVRQYMNPLMSSPDELTTQRFYLRKLEGADILLAEEINFFRQELHKWAPVAPTPPPAISVSLSTRKPRPTKQQRLMNQLGISDPRDLPEQPRKQYTYKNDKRQQSVSSQSRSLNIGKDPINLGPERSRTPPPSNEFQGQGTRPTFEQQEYSEMPPNYNNSPNFATTSSMGFGPSSIPAIDPGLFEGGGQGPTSPIQDIFRSSGSAHEMFGEMMDTGGGHAEEALAVTEGNSYGE